MSRAVFSAVDIDTLRQRAESIGEKVIVLCENNRFLVREDALSAIRSISSKADMALMKAEKELALLIGEIGC